MKIQVDIRILPADAVTLSAPFQEDYALLLVISTRSITKVQRERIASDVVASRCQYALTYGNECQMWHDAIDMAGIDAGGPESRFLMTTWHDDEPIEDVIDYLWWNTSYDYFEAERLAIVQIGPDAKLETAIRERVSYHLKRQAEQIAAADRH